MIKSIQQQNRFYLHSLLLMFVFCVGCGKDGNLQPIKRPRPPVISQTNKIDLQLAPASDNNNQSLQEVVEDFLGQPLSGSLRGIAIIFNDDSISVAVQDEERMPFVVSQIELQSDQSSDIQEEEYVVYGDSYGSVYFILEDQTSSRFRIYFENLDEQGSVISSGVLGFATIPACQVSQTC